MTDALIHSELGKKSKYDTQYNPEKLFAVPRKLKREEMGVRSPLPFFGFDLWNHYEVSWLNEKGKPMVAVAEIIYGCESPNVVESKSLKLYFNSFNQTKWKDEPTLASIIKNDLEDRVGAPVAVKIIPLNPVGEPVFSCLKGICLDDLDLECSRYTADASYLKTEDEQIEETVHSNLLRSNCLVTHQPDWGSIEITYQGKKINHEGLLRYIVSFRNHHGFHEHCIEQIFMDILRQCNPHHLTVYGRYTRRGGIDINPYRSTDPVEPQDKNLRLLRQ